MSNHIHILLKTGKEDIDVIMKRIAGSYVYWYNWKYYRKGHLFQDRFKSEPVDDNEYFLKVMRYIHQNPMKSGIVKDINGYPNCSYWEYAEDKDELADKNFVYEIIERESFIEYHREENEDKCLDIDELVFRLSDEDVIEEIKKVSGCENTTEFLSLNPMQRDKCIKKLKDKGLSIRQISRLTGVSKGMVERIR